MRLKKLEINGFKSFHKKTILEFLDPIVCIVGPNGSGKSNVVEAVRFVLGEQSMKSMRGKAGLDFIFKGSKHLPKSSRASISISFNNTDKIFKLANENGENMNLDYDHVSIAREVYPDGINKYILNGTEVRLKDINALLASVNIGSSGHHIISQGEADRILNASPKDRREMVEDALGLKIYQYKIKEAERKLIRTSENMKEVSLLKREITPHLNFLKKQVDRFEKAKEMKVELLSLYQEYLKKENVYLEKEKKHLADEKSRISQELSGLDKKISKAGGENIIRENKKSEELRNLEQQISEIRRAKGEIERKLGRIEGMIELEENRDKKPQKAENISIPKEEMESFLKEMHEYLEEAMYMDVLENIAPVLGKIKDILDRFSRMASPNSEIKQNISVNLEELRKNQKAIVSEMKKIEEEEQKIAKEIEKLKNEIKSEQEAGREEEREKFNLRVRHQELSSNLEVLKVKEESLHRELENFENEIKEGSALIGPDILSYKNFSPEANQPLAGEMVVDKFKQEELKKKIERIKIKLEDVGAGGGAEIMKEFNDLAEREKFLTKEMEDLSVSIKALEELMGELKQKIDTEFQAGIQKINVEFQEFFALMFGGGTGHLSIISERRRRSEEDSEEEEEKPEQGVEISVSLPHKKVKELHALSGGERSLTSIALLFAMSQVNPPPFLVLDETDAALDEANSRKFGDMLEKLSKRSQLVVVTHNRETMSRAGVLYGVTIGADGGSKLLSVKFEEATAIAK